MEDNEKFKDIPDEVFVRADYALNILLTEVLPHFAQLTAKQIADYSKMGDKSMPFVIKAFEYATQYPILMSRQDEIKVFERELTIVEKARQMGSQFEVLTNGAANTRIFMGMLANRIARHIYRNSKTAMDEGVPGAKEAYHELKIRFEKNGSKGKNDSNPDQKV